MRYMLDTNICIYLLQSSHPALLERLAFLQVGDCVMSVVTYAELCAGLQVQPATRARNSAALRELLELIPVLPFEEPAAAQYGVIRTAQRRGSSKDAFDRLIAAHATALGLVLVTNNMADFAGYAGLTVENWAG
jgi:tRNA(fMet)-specific endonuclease VapC